MDLRPHAMTALLAVAILTTGACSAQQAGTPLPAAARTAATASTTGTAPTTAAAPTAGSAAVTSTVTSTETVTSTSVARSTPAVTQMPDTVAPPTSDDNPPSTTRTTTPRATSSAPDDPDDGVDAVTHRWILGMCTDMQSVLAAVADVPDSDESAPLGRYRQDYVDYYSRLATAAQQALDGARSGRPPAVANGAQIHQRFIIYLTGLQDVAASGAALIAKEAAASDISADVTQLSNEMQDLGNSDAGLGDLASPELESAIAAAPECKDLAG